MKLEKLLAYIALRLKYLVVVSNASGLPATIVPAWITLVQLEAVVGVPAHVEYGDAKWTLA